MAFSQGLAFDPLHVREKQLAEVRRSVVLATENALQGQSEEPGRDLHHGITL